ncbi:hypothetical protein [Tsukamurella sp. PLM1]|uniref:hypothetical protein n=1 Tax=Tsukamurella sp. PLM1 TaxID=2929795 RepID=UPI0020BDA0BB|nr:hypothetical protein [Tsukamurella sp. PLM1]
MLVSVHRRSERHQQGVDAAEGAQVREHVVVGQGRGLAECAHRACESVRAEILEQRRIGAQGRGGRGHGFGQR